jgi:hypothetical protein
MQLHCCPVKKGGCAFIGMFSNAILTIQRGVDLNSIWHFSEGFRGGAGEQWQDGPSADDGHPAAAIPAARQTRCERHPC